jgi:recombination protein RecA
VALDAGDEEVRRKCLLNVEWHPVVSVMSVGNRMTYDVAGTGWENFLLAGMVTHNTAVPFRKAEFYVSFGYGVDRAAAVLDAALARGVVEKRGSWFSFGDEQLAQGRGNSLEVLRSDQEVFKRMEEAIREAAENKPEVGADGVERKAVTGKDPEEAPDSSKTRNAGTVVEDA